MSRSIMEVIDWLQQGVHHRRLRPDGRWLSEDPNSADIIKPILRGRDIQKYRAKWAGLVVDCSDIRKLQARYQTSILRYTSTCFDMRTN